MLVVPLLLRGSLRLLLLSALLLLLILFFLRVPLLLLLGVPFLLLLGVLLLSFLRVLLLLLLGVLLLLLGVLLLLLLVMFWLLPSLLWLGLLLRVLLFGLPLLVSAPLLFRPALLFALLLLLRAGRSSDSKQQRQNGCASNCNRFHRCSASVMADCVRLLYRKLPVVALGRLPIASPDTRSSTLRFCCRPAELSLVATGKVLPKPLALTALFATPCCTR